ncbi:MAG: hypothetical protein AAB244_07505, partial [Nitrospirota bacterium]
PWPGLHEFCRFDGERRGLDDVHLVGGRVDGEGLAEGGDIPEAPVHQMLPAHFNRGKEEALW